MNKLRVKTHGLSPMCWVWGTRDFLKAKIPEICLWSPQVLPRPSDWDDDVVIGGFTTLNPGKTYTPPDSLSTFLQTDDPVIAISFGSMHIPDPARLISAISVVAASIQAKVVICRSWSAKLEADNMDMFIPEHVYLADEIPHGWLLPVVDGFVHHGGTGHMAAGIRAGVPMLIMPFCFDQNFWAAKVHELGLGPLPLCTNSLRSLDANKLAQRLGDLVSGRYSDTCTKMAARVQDEVDGADVAAGIIMEKLEVSQSKGASCVVIPSLKADWEHIDSGLSLSGAAAASLVAFGIICWDDLNAQVRVNWAEKWQNQTSKSRLHILCWMMSWLSPISHVMSILLAILSPPPRPAKDVNAVDMEFVDPVRQARIRRSVYDLELIRQNADGKVLEERFVQHWKGLAAAEFYGRFNLIS
jgi:hypothetical protein